MSASGIFVPLFQLVILPVKMLPIVDIWTSSRELRGVCVHTWYEDNAI